MINIENISYSIGRKKQRKTLIKMDRLVIEKNQFTALIGPNGAGKTTLLHLLAGDINADHGHIRIDNKFIQDYSIRELSCKRAVLPQSQHIPFAINVRAILLMGIMPYDVSYDDSRVQQLLLEIAERLELTSLMNQTYQTLSGGEQHRAQIGRVMMQVLFGLDEDPACERLLLLDEPFNHLDLYHQQQLLQYLKELNNRKITIVCIMHDLNHAVQCADAIVIIADGKLHGVYQKEILFNSTILEDVFGVRFIKLTHPDFPEVYSFSSFLL